MGDSNMSDGNMGDSNMGDSNMGDSDLGGDTGRWLLKYDDERATKRWTAVGPDGRLGDVDSADAAIALLRAAGAPKTLTFLDVRFEAEVTAATPPILRAVVIDTTDARSTAEFYRQLLGYTYRPGDEPPADGTDDPKGRDWLVLLDGSGQPRMSFQNVDELARTTWPDPDVPMQLHVDLTVSNPEQLRSQVQRARDLGAELVLDRSDDPDEPLYVFADPAGHPFCILIG